MTIANTPPEINLGFELDMALTVVNAAVRTGNAAEIVVERFDHMPPADVLLPFLHELVRDVQLVQDSLAKIETVI